MAEAHDRSYDYVVVGSGAGGGPLAANLALAGYTVCVIEAGGDIVETGSDESRYRYQVPILHPEASEDPAQAWPFFVRHYADQERQAKDSKYDVAHDGILYPRAGTLGGCTAHNAMIIVYPHNSDWDHLARLTKDPSWSSNTMRGYFEKLEDCQYFPATLFHKVVLWLFQRLGFYEKNPSRHGFKGWLTTSMADPTLALKDMPLLKIIRSAIKYALQKDIGNPFIRLRSTFDPNDWRVVRKSPAGIAFTPLSTNNGRRIGSRERLVAVRKKHPDRLTILTHCLATRVLLDDENTATGVAYIQGENLYRADATTLANSPLPEPKMVRAKREVIVAGGAFNTPQLLKLSGIGPREELEKYGIDVRIDRPGVGKNLQDRYEVCVISTMKEDLDILEGVTFALPEPGKEPDDTWRDWENDGSGLYASNGVAIGLIKRSKSKKERPDPDLYIFGLPGYFKGYYPGYSQWVGETRRHFSWAILKGHTQNTAGMVTLRSSDPRDPPTINFKYFDEGTDADNEDLESVIEGVLAARAMNRRVRRSIEQEVLPGPQVQTREQIGEFIKNEAWGHHASCSCKIGRPDDPNAVLDGNFRVYGAKNLRVVDASVFPRIPGLFIVSAVYMISEKASDVIIADARAS